MFYFREWREHSPRKRAIIYTASFWITMAGFMTLLAQSGWDRRVLIGVVVPLAWAIAIMTIRCPRCGTPLAKRKIQFLGEEWWLWGGAIKRSCAKCGKDLSINPQPTEVPRATPSQ